MDNQKVSYNTQTYNPVKGFVVALPVYLIMMFLLFWISISLHNPWFGVIGWVLISTVPFLFQKQFKRNFTRKVELEFDNQSILIKELGLDNDLLLKEQEISWDSIKSYKCYFSSTDVTYFTIYFLNGTSKNFSFKDEKDQKQAIKEKSVFSIFFYFVVQHNLGKQENEQITFRPGFLTTKSGALLLYIFAILAVILIIVHMVINPRSSMLSFMSLFIIMGLVAKRSVDKTFYKMISTLEPRNPF